MKFTYGEGNKGGIPLIVSATWQEYVDALREFSTVKRHPSTKDSTPWTSMMISNGQSRQIGDIIGVSCFAALDLDELGWTIEKITERLNGVEFIAYTTTKSQQRHQRWRIIVKLDRECTVEEYSGVWAFLNATFDGKLDQNTKNANRIFYVPAQWEGADNLFIHSTGIELPVDELIEGYELVPPVSTPSLIRLGKSPRPAHIPIITQWNIAKFHAATSHGGRFYEMLIRAAIRHREEDWEITATELATAALAVSPRDSSGPRKNAVREAERALGWAEANVKPQTPMEKLSAKLKQKTINNKGYYK